MRHIAIIFVFALASSAAFAGVSYKNGNFFISYNDCTVTGGMGISVEVTYNSKSSFDGRFGFGSGTEYETFGKPSGDGSFVIYENGGGAQNRFVSDKVNLAQVDKIVSEIVTVRSKSGAGLSGSRAEAEKQRLRNDARYRTDEWDKLFEKGLVKTSPLAEGTVLRSNRFSFQTIVKTRAGFERHFENGQVQTFSDAGKLVRIADKNGNYLSLAYSKSGQIDTVQDNLNRKFRFTVNRAGKVEKIATDDGKTAVYRYNGIDLVYRKDCDGNVYDYKYSNDGRHNLVEVRYADKSTLQISYYPVSRGETVKSIKDRDGSLTEYNYGGEGALATNYWTSVSVKSPDGKTVSSSRYEYTEKAKPDGERYTYRLVSEVDGDKTDTIYNECCGLPLVINRNGEKTSFEYDVKGHVTKKITPSEVTELSYDPKANKVSKVVKYSKTDASKKSVQWAQYEYDAKGNLVFAKNSDGKGVRVVYDHAGRIKAMVDQNKTKLEFSYNEANKPVEIKNPAVGAIRVQYSNSGDIKKVESTSGDRRIAVQVTSAFQNLLEIIRPAGVTLTF